MKVDFFLFKLAEVRVLVCQFVLVYLGISVVYTSHKKYGSRLIGQKL